MTNEIVPRILGAGRIGKVHTESITPGCPAVGSDCPALPRISGDGDAG